MRVVVDGEERSLPEGLSVAEWLVEEQLPADHVLVEINGTYVPREQFEERRIAEGDRIEVILPAFGG